jgi:hypothetical protein
LPLAPDLELAPIPGPDVSLRSLAPHTPARAPRPRSRSPARRRFVGARGRVSVYSVAMSTRP